MCSIWKKASVWATTCTGCTNQDVFFLILLSPPPLRCLSVFSLISPSVLLWTLTSVPSPGCLSQTAVQHCDNAFVFPNLFMNFLFSYPFFCSFPQGLAHLMLNRQGMGSIGLLYLPNHQITAFPFPAVILVNCVALIFPILFLPHICLFVFASCHVMLTVLTQFLSVKPLSWPLTELLEHHLWPLQFFTKVMHLCS